MRVICNGRMGGQDRKVRGHVIFSRGLVVRDVVLIPRIASSKLARTSVAVQVKMGLML